MKIQDIIFLIVFAILLLKKDARLATAFGIISLALSMPLFSLWIFFTAERLTWYAAAFFLLGIFQILWRLRNAYRD